VYKKGDYASSYADFWAAAYEYPVSGIFYADEGMYLYGYASRLLADPNAQNAARGTAKVDSATWSAAALANYVGYGQVGVEGETGFTENGGGIMLSGVGVGAATKGANVVYAAIEQGEESDFYTGLDEWVRVTLQAPQYSGTDTGGVGAYVGLANLNMYLMDPDYLSPSPFPIVSTGLIWTKTIENQNGVWWNNNAIYTAQGHAFFGTPQDSISPIDSGVPVEVGPIAWTWQAGGVSGAYIAYKAATVYV
jgi:hypothetical protein